MLGQAVRSVKADGTDFPSQHKSRLPGNSPPAKLGRTPCWTSSLRPSASMSGMISWQYNNFSQYWSPCDSLVGRWQWARYNTAETHQIWRYHTPPALGSVICLDHFASCDFGLALKAWDKYVKKRFYLLSGFYLTDLFTSKKIAPSIIRVEAEYYADFKNVKIFCVTKFPKIFSQKNAFLQN